MTPQKPKLRKTITNPATPDTQSKQRTLRQMFIDGRKAAETPYTQSKLNPHKPGTPGHDHLVKTGAVEAKPEKAERVEKPKKPVISEESQKVTILNKDNPHEAGSKRGKHWVKMLKCKTTGEYREAGGRMDLLESWVAKKHIKLG